MTSVLRDRYVVQPLLLLLVSLAVVALWGCAPRVSQTGSSSAPPSTTSDDKTTAAKLVGEESPFAVDEPSEDDRATDTPGVDSPNKVDVATDLPVEDDEPAAGKEPDPTDDVTVKWLPEPIEVADAEADTEAEMNNYVEAISDTDVTFEMIKIPGGNFMMGSPDDEPKRNDDEGPRHEVVIEPFWMGKCEVTWEEYELYGLSLDKQRRELKHKAAGTEPSQREKLIDAVARPTNPYSDMSSGMGKDGYPAICMTQLAAKGYCRWLSAKTGRLYRLPTEAEWEHACRAGTTTAYSFGDDPKDLDDYAWHFENSDDAYHKIGQKKPNPWGLHDMHGNVQEWVLDQFIPERYQQLAGNTTKNPLAVPKTLYPRVVRGGCWDDDPEALRSAARRGSTNEWKAQDPQLPQSIWYHTEVYCPGFRVVRPLRVPTVEEAKAYEWDVQRIREYQEAQAGKE